MTLAPLVDPTIKGVEGKPGDVSRTCAAPGCGSPSQQRHHMWSRSYLRGQPYEWVSVMGQTFQNTVGLCVACHSAVTGEIGGHRAHIRFDPGLRLFEWWAKAEDDHWFHVGPLLGQGLIPAQPPEARRVRESEGLCPECGRPRHNHTQTKRAPGPKRKTATWGVVVPDDAEVGTDIMDDWIDSFASLLGFGEAPARLKRYHVLALVLPWVDMNRAKLLADLEEAQFWANSPSE